MNDAKPMRDWTASELVQAARERGTVDPLLSAMADRLELMQAKLGTAYVEKGLAEIARDNKGARGRQRRNAEFLRS